MLPQRPLLHPAWDLSQPQKLYPGIEKFVGKNMLEQKEPIPSIREPKTRNIFAGESLNFVKIEATLMHLQE